jgi:inosose dehydratase
MTRRSFLAAPAAVMAAPAASRSQAQITVGITSNTRPDWEGGGNFLRSLKECHQLGYHWIETFWGYLEPWWDQPQRLQALLEKLDLRMETVSNGGPLNMRFQDPTAREDVIADHMRLVAFIKDLGCDHLKINCGARNPGGNTIEIYREQAKTFDELGRRISDEGLKFGIHAHLWSQFETPQDVGTIMAMTDPDHVHLILDTGHVSMAGMDPVRLTRVFGHRIIEYHLKDVALEHYGGYRGSDIEQGSVNNNAHDRIFFELGEGGVNFPAIKAHLDSIGWKGWFTVELDRTGSFAIQSAAKSKRYIEETLGLKV